MGAFLGSVLLFMVALLLGAFWFGLGVLVIGIAVAVFIAFFGALLMQAAVAWALVRKEILPGPILVVTVLLSAAVVYYMGEPMLGATLSWRMLVNVPFHGAVVGLVFGLWSLTVPRPSPP